MPTRLTNPQQRALLNALPAHRKNAVKSHCQSCQMRGEGFMDILKSIGGVLGPIAKEVGPVVLKEFILPFVKKKIAGKGLSPAGGSLRLAGQGKKTKKPKMVKGSAEAKAHMARIRAMRK
tara:strand:- start:469 stop:828 length:360 start_codon:yes stop_codon:yes gene_type:complete